MESSFLFYCHFGYSLPNRIRTCRHDLSQLMRYSVESILVLDHLWRIDSCQRLCLHITRVNFSHLWDIFLSSRSYECDKQTRSLSVIRRIRSLSVEKGIGVVLATIFSIVIGCLIVVWWILGIVRDPHSFHHLRTRWSMMIDLVDKTHPESSLRIQTIRYFASLSSNCVLDGFVGEYLWFNRLYHSNLHGNGQRVNIEMKMIQSEWSNKSIHARCLILHS